MKRQSDAIITAGSSTAVSAREVRLLRIAGRPVGHTLFGDPGARTGLVYLHGFPGSCLEPALLSERLRSERLGLLALDRPGYGKTRVRSGDAGDPAITARLVASLVAHYGWKRYAILAVSGAGTASVAALADPDPRLAGCLFLSVFPPTFVAAPRPDAGILRLHRDLLRRVPGFVRIEARLIAGHFGRRPARLRERLIRLLPSPDREALSDPRLGGALEASWARGLCGGGGRGLVVDFAHFLRPLAPPPAPSFPCLSVHGSRDRVVPPELQDHLLRALPFVSRVRWPEAGHFSWADSRLEEILAVLRSWLSG